MLVYVRPGSPAEWFGRSLMTQIYYHFEYVGLPRSYKWTNSVALVCRHHCIALPNSLSSQVAGKGMAPAPIRVQSKRQTDMAFQCRRPEAAGDSNYMGYEPRMGHQQHWSR